MPRVESDTGQGTQKKTPKRLYKNFTNISKFSFFSINTILFIYLIVLFECSRGCEWESIMCLWNMTHLIHIIAYFYITGLIDFHSY